MAKVLEFERKYVLDLGRMEAIRSVLTGRLNAMSELVQQCYVTRGDEDVTRWRRTRTECLKEQKDSCNIDATYAVHREHSVVVAEREFLTAWQFTDKKLQKIRYTVDHIPVRLRKEEDFSRHHTLVVDFFFKAGTSLFEVVDDIFPRTYAVIAEVEGIVDASTKTLDLKFRLPTCLRDYLVWEVDRRDPRSRAFTSMNMCDTPQMVDRVTEAIKALK